MMTLRQNINEALFRDASKTDEEKMCDYILDKVSGTILSGVSITKILPGRVAVLRSEKIHTRVELAQFMISNFIKICKKFGVVKFNCSDLVLNLNIDTWDDFDFEGTTWTCDKLSFDKHKEEIGKYNIKNINLECSELQLYYTCDQSKKSRTDIYFENVNINVREWALITKKSTWFFEFGKNVLIKVKNKIYKNENVFKKLVMHGSL